MKNLMKNPLNHQFPYEKNAMTSGVGAQAKTSAALQLVEQDMLAFQVGCRVHGQ